MAKESRHLPHEPRPVRLAAVSWSGGKDSALTLARLAADPAVRVVSLLTTVASEFDRISIHGVRRSLLYRQAERLGLPVVEIPLPPASTNAVYEAGFSSALEGLARAFPGLRTLAFGDLFLEDVREYRDRLLARSGWEGLYPLWGEPTGSLARRFVQSGYRAILTCVDTTRLDGAFAGREYDAALLADLPASVDPCGEHGEFHTFVYAGPGFDRPIPVVRGERVLREARFVYCDLQEAAPPR